MARYKTLAMSPAISRCSWPEYLKTIDIRSHCFALCVLFVSRKLKDYYHVIHDIQMNHEKHSNTESELADKDKERLQIAEHCLRKIKLNTANDQSAMEVVFRDINSDHFMIVLELGSFCHSIGFRKCDWGNYFEVLDTSSCVESDLTLFRINSMTNIKEYLQGTINQYVASADPIRSVRLLTYTTTS